MEEWSPESYPYQLDTQGHFHRGSDCSCDNNSPPTHESVLTRLSSSSNLHLSLPLSRCLIQPLRHRLPAVFRPPHGLVASLWLLSAGSREKNGSTFKVFRRFWPSQAFVLCSTVVRELALPMLVELLSDALGWGGERRVDFELFGRGGGRGGGGELAL